ncbi:clathrin light chain isoform X2 [Diabrotica virgifera virgifera]|uniref:Clathrin light chain n=1 Tax=Diabrotica virgifera virgifera TaxID=50390 RepID=A0A6P7FA64_DIAVI|nr:clathrin light chain isoform X2 [Diabrotica virgifera virgifera]
MSGFGDNFGVADEDPAAEFLAREQDELAGLEDEVKPAAVIAPVLNGDIPADFDPDKEYRERVSPLTIRQEDRVEPEKIRLWREEQIKRLEEKDQEEEKKKQELREVAKKELEDWYKNHEEAIAKTKAANRNAEKQFVAEDDELEPGTEWERIAKLCDFNPKAKQGSKDVSRMRSIVLQMKQNPVPIKNKA